MSKELKNIFHNSQLLYIYNNKIKKILWFLGKNIFSLLLIFILLDIIFTEFLLFQYIFLVNGEESSIINVSTKFKENVYQSVLKELQEREIIFKNLP